MNREIKFRGKRLDNGKWVYGDLMRNICGTRIVRYKESKDKSVSRVVWDYVDVDPATVGQYTGLKDVNKVEIYEGDILGIPENVGFLPETVIFINGCFMADDGYTRSPLCHINTVCRVVVGNIHEQGKDAKK